MATDDTYDDIDFLIDNDPIALGKRCRRAESRLAELTHVAKRIRDIGDGIGFGGYSPHECVFCESNLHGDWDPVTGEWDTDYSPQHDPDCEFRQLDVALRGLTDAYGEVLQREREWHEAAINMHDEVVHLKIQLDAALAENLQIRGAAIDVGGQQ